MGKRTRLPVSSIRRATTITQPMSAPLKEKITLTHLRNARRDNTKLPILTCYDFSMARLMHEAGVPAILVGDSASNVVLGHDTTLAITAAPLLEASARFIAGGTRAKYPAPVPYSPH